MGQASRPKPLRLAEKLVDVRTRLGLSQNELIRRLGMIDELTQARISAYERGVREPPLIVLLSYARSCLGGGEYLEILIDDELDLPEKLPVNPKSEAIRRQTKSPIKRKN
jgi:transcriptional regulator with XRE-family HTH domain